MEILIIGGYGVFGGRLCELLALEPLKWCGKIKIRRSPLGVSRNHTANVLSAPR
jgi:hypothetical protein